LRSVASRKYVPMDSKPFLATCQMGGNVRVVVSQK
jgi:hypothetical protein